MEIENRSKEEIGISTARETMDEAQKLLATPINPSNEDVLISSLNVVKVKFAISLSTLWIVEPIDQFFLRTRNAARFRISYHFFLSAASVSYKQKLLCT